MNTIKDTKILLKDFIEFYHDKCYKNCWPDKDGNWVYDYTKMPDEIVEDFIDYQLSKQSKQTDNELSNTFPKMKEAVDGLMNLSIIK